LAIPEPEGGFPFAELAHVHLGAPLEEQILASPELDLRLGTVRDAHPRPFHNGEIVGIFLPLAGIGWTDPGSPLGDHQAGDSGGWGDFFVRILRIGRPNGHRNDGQCDRNGKSRQRSAAKCFHGNLLL